MLYEEFTTLYGSEVPYSTYCLIEAEYMEGDEDKETFVKRIKRIRRIEQIQAEQIKKSEQIMQHLKSHLQRVSTMEKEVSQRTQEIKEMGIPHYHPDQETTKTHKEIQSHTQHVRSLSVHVAMFHILDLIERMEDGRETI